MPSTKTTMPVVKGSGKRNLDGKDLATEKLWLVGRLAAGWQGADKTWEKTSNQKGHFPWTVCVCVSLLFYTTALFVFFVLWTPTPYSYPLQLSHQLWSMGFCRLISFLPSFSLVLHLSATSLQVQSFAVCEFARVFFCCPNYPEPMKRPQHILNLLLENCQISSQQV